jgi:hypothetical protein
MNRLVIRDEREVSVDHAADRLSYLVLAFGLLVIVAWRSFAAGESSWELLALVVVAGAVGAGYRAWEGAASGSWAWLVAGTVAVALVVAAFLGWSGRS